MYDIEFSVKAAKVYLRLSKDIRKKIDAKLKILAAYPHAKHNNVKMLKGVEKCYRLRIGNWRLIYEVVSKKLKIYVIKIGQRKEVYRK